MSDKRGEPSEPTKLSPVNPNKLTANPSQTQRKPTPLKTSSKVVSWEQRLPRIVLGGSAAITLIAGLAIRMAPGVEANSDNYFSGMLVKIGIVLGVAWLAAPQLERFGWHRLRGTALVAVILVLVLYAIRPRIGAWAGALLIAGGTFFALVGWFRGLIDKPKN